ncbi:MAG: phosphoenolpyruvate--protein phosphotransferase [Alphaproteobacteria bacterium]|nr:MAG: phosphoenolpyruvate--protein phosphotransferase [Alphaproteobacteria bacterium]
MKISGYGIQPDDKPESRPFGETSHLKGSGVSPGVAIGVVYLIEHGTIGVPRYTIADHDIGAEKERLEAAAKKSVSQVEKLIAQIADGDGGASDELGEILSAHVHMLQGSRLIRGALALIGERRLNAEAAVQSMIREISGQYAAIKDTYLAARVHDIEDVGHRLIRNLVDAPVPSFANLPEGCIVLAEEITPADTALMDPARISGFATTFGGAEAHTAIMARSLGLPAVVGINDLVAAAQNGDLAILDGQSGALIVNPSPYEVEQYQKRQDEIREEKRQLAHLRELPAETTDGMRVQLSANLELASEMEMALDAGAQSIGLVRTEFMFMNRETLPSEEEQTEVLSELVQKAAGLPVTIRTLDVGGDKIARGLGLEVSGEGANPALGLRAIRFSLKQRDLYERQVAAILRASAVGPVRILLPMITTAEEVKAARRLIAGVYKRLTDKGEGPSALPPVGIMIEVPAAALSADALANVSDFFSIGTNDLTQYTLAIDRTNDQVASLFDVLNPAVLRLIQFAASAAENAGIPINLCGEMAGDERLTPLLLGLGLTELSMSAPALLRVKRRIRELSQIAAEDCAARIMAQTDRAQIAAILSDFNELSLTFQ